MMNIEAKKIELVKMILESDNFSLLDALAQIFKKPENLDFWETLSDEQKVDILQGIEDIERDEIVDYDTFMAKHR